jgi:hypothetical protein
MLKLPQLVTTLFLSLAAISIIAPSPAEATSFMPTPFPTSVQNAPIILRGKVGMSYPEFAQDPDGGKRIFTFTEIQPTEVLKGDVRTAANSLIIREMGGEKDGVGYHVPGTAQFQRGEDTVIFLRPADRDGTFDVHGMMMGKYNVITNSEGQEVLDGPGLILDPNAPPEKWTLDRLRKVIAQQAEMNPTPAAAASPAPQLQPLKPQVAPSAAPSKLEEPQNVKTEEPRSWQTWAMILFVGAILGILMSRYRKR